MISRNQSFGCYLLDEPGMTITSSLRTSSAIRSVPSASGPEYFSRVLRSRSAIVGAGYSGLPKRATCVYATSLGWRRANSAPASSGAMRCARMYLAIVLSRYSWFKRTCALACRKRRGRCVLPRAAYGRPARCWLRGQQHNGDRTSLPRRAARALCEHGKRTRGARR